MNRHRTYWCGGVDSKYFHNPDQLDKDIENKLKHWEAIEQDAYNYFDKLIQDNPSKAHITTQCIIDAVRKIMERYNITL